MICRIHAPIVLTHGKGPAIRINLVFSSALGPVWSLVPVKNTCIWKLKTNLNRAQEDIKLTPLRDLWCMKVSTFHNDSFYWSLFSLLKHSASLQGPGCKMADSVTYRCQPWCTLGRELLVATGHGDVLLLQPSRLPVRRIDDRVTSIYV